MNKKERIKLVPKYRFPEFRNSDSWDRGTLAKLADRVEEKVGENELTTLSISAGTGFVSQAEKFSRDISGNQYKNYIHLRKGDFSYNKGNSKTFPQGCIYELIEYEEAAVPNAFISFHFKDNYVPYFYKGYFENNFHGKQLTRFITSGARMDGLLNIKASDFFSIVLPTPTEREEQQKIADCLSSIDDLISAEDKKLSALKDYKKGLMQKLFPAEGRTVPEWRFPEFADCTEWELIPIGKKVDLLSGYAFKGEEISQNCTGIPLMRGINITEGWVRHNQDIDRFFCGCLDGLEKYQLQKNDLVIGMDGSKVGKNSALITADDVGSLLIQRVARLRAASIATIKFVFHHINSSKFHSYVDKINTSSGIPHISAAQIQEFKIYFPIEEKEQQKIADCLSSVEELITAQTDKIEALKQHKKGLMQGLFPLIEEVSR
mgnify:CR=1 FL=1